MACLTCEELDARICALAEELATADTCLGGRTTEAGVDFDNRGQLDAKKAALEAYRRMWETKRCGEANEGQLYEFTAVACVTPGSCRTTGCRSSRQSLRGSRRYRR